MIQIAGKLMAGLHRNQDTALGTKPKEKKEGLPMHTRPHRYTPQTEQSMNKVRILFCFIYNYSGRRLSRREGFSNERD